MKANLWQDDSDFWTLEVQWDSGIIESMKMGRLSKEQAGREAVRRCPGVVIQMFDKHSMKAWREGRVIGVLPIQAPK